MDVRGVDSNKAAQEQRAAAQAQSRRQAEQRAQQQEESQENPRPPEALEAEGKGTKINVSA